MVTSPNWFTANTKIPYPFVGPAVPIELEDADFRTLFVDAYVRYTAPVLYGGLGAREVHLRLDRFDYDPPGSSDSSVSSESGSSSGSSQSSVAPGPHFGVRLSWADGVPFLNTDSPGGGQLMFNYREWGDWLVLEWIYLRDIDDAADYDRIVRFVLDNRKLLSFMYPIVPTAAYIVPGRVEQGSSKVTTLRFINHSGAETVIPDPSLLSPLTEVQLVAGYNTRMETYEEVDLLPATASVRGSSKFLLDFEPGAGKGVYPGCEEPEPALRTLNQVGPDPEGNFVLAAEECYFIDREMVTPGDCGVAAPEIPWPPPLIPIDIPNGVKEAKLRLHNVCVACCKCEDYVDSYSKISDAWALLRDARNTYLSVKAEVERIIADFNNVCAGGACDKVVGQIVSYMKHSWLLTGQAIIYNATGQTLAGLDLSFQLICEALPYRYVPNSAWIVTPEEDRRVSDGAGHAQAIMLSEPIAPGTVVMFEYEVYFPENMARMPGVPVQWLLSGTLGGQSFYSMAMDCLQPPFNHT